MADGSLSCSHESAPAPAVSWLAHLRTGLLYYYLTSLVALVGVVAGHDLLRPPAHPVDRPGDLLSAFAHWDGRWYARIVSDGYSYDPRQPSSVAFFPAFPMLGRLVAVATGLRPEAALLLVAHLCLAATFVVLAAYVHQRFGADGGRLVPWVLLAFGLWPTSCFFRLAYSEPLFLLGLTLALYGLERRWPLPVLAWVIGLATATRPVGVALLVPLALYVWRWSPTRRGTLLRLAVFLPAACWGLAAYALYQQAAFGDGLAFARTQENWRARSPLSLEQKAVALATLEPLWSVYDPSSPCWWERHADRLNPLFSLHFANPLYFLLAIGLTALGAWRRWLDRYEVTLAAGLLLIPYLTRSTEMCMQGMGRFAAVVVPLYLVLGLLLRCLPVAVAVLLLGGSTFLLGAYAALFGAGYPIF